MASTQISDSPADGSKMMIDTVFESRPAGRLFLRPVRNFFDVFDVLVAAAIIEQPIIVYYTNQSATIWRYKMLRELTLNVDETLYNTLLPMVEKQTIGNLLTEFIQTKFSRRTYSQSELENGYKAMADDKEYESEAMEWCNGLMNGIDDETR